MQSLSETTPAIMTIIEMIFGYEKCSPKKYIPIKVINTIPIALQIA